MSGQPTNDLVDIILARAARILSLSVAGSFCFSVLASISLFNALNSNLGNTLTFSDYTVFTIDIFVPFLFSVIFLYVCWSVGNALGIFGGHAFKLARNIGSSIF